MKAQRHLILLASAASIVLSFTACSSDRVVVQDAYTGRRLDGARVVNRHASGDEVSYTDYSGQAEHSGGGYQTRVSRSGYVTGVVDR